MKTIKEKGKRLDFAQIAHAVVEAATSEDEKQPLAKESIAVESGRRGGMIGGKARAEKLTQMSARLLLRRRLKPVGGKYDYSRHNPNHSGNLFIYCCF
jgi:hypothetical protein